MADLTSTQLKLRTTPTAGVSGENSPYYRRLLSAGYKGFLQGTIGGSTLYGVLGAAIGATLAIPALFVPGVGVAALAAIPFLGAVGMYKGASTFGQIGSIAAITAESAEMSEKRRYLLDRYYDLPDTPDFDGEAAQIQKMLARQHESDRPHGIFHWKTVLVGAALGVGVALLLSSMGPALLGFTGIHTALDGVAAALGFVTTEAAAAAAAHGTVAAGIAVSSGIAAGIGAIAGGLIGGMIGLDRFYIRQWLDKTADVMTDRRSVDDQVRAREMEVEALGRTAGIISAREPQANKISGTAMAPSPDTAPTRSHVEEHGKPVIASLSAAEAHPARELPIDPRVIAGLEKPSTTASGIEHLDRIHAAMRNPVL